MTALHGDIEAAKRQARAAALAARARAHAANGGAAGARLRDHFFAAFSPGPGAAVAGYWPMRDEIDVRPLLAALAARGHAIGLPVILGRGQPLVFRQWRPGESLAAAGFGLSEPPASAPTVDPDLLIVPLVAFDGAGRRLGYGAGYYDRTLNALRARRPVLAIGVAYAEQALPAVPVTGTDEPLDAVLTERGVLKPGAAPA